MSCETYVMRNGKLVPKRLAAPRSTDPCVHVISDTMDLTWHPATGVRVDSKAKFRQMTKDAGCVEVGTEKLTPRKFKPQLSRQERGEHIKRAIEQLRAGR